MPKTGKYKSEVVMFNGIKFRRYPESKNYSDRNYFRPGPHLVQRGVEALHREVWKAHHGVIPDGYHVHHRDGNTSNNAIENLELMPGLEHLKMHGETQTVGQREQSRQRINSMRDKATEWHRSTEGRAWHKEHGKEIWAGRKPITCKCDNCGMEFETLALHGNVRFCSEPCKQRYAYNHRAEKGLTKTQTCQWCGKEYQVYKYEGRQKFCGRSCSAKARMAARKAKAESK